MVYFAVITKVPEDTEGNYACAEAYINPKASQHIAGSNIIVSPPKLNEELFVKAISARGKQNIIDLSIEQIVICNTPVFSLGEIMVMGANDRTIPDGRKPSKWDVTYEAFTDIDAAVKRALEVVVWV
jgi:hypothetical protein